MKISPFLLGVLLSALSCTEKARQKVDAARLLTDEEQLIQLAATVKPGEKWEVWNLMPPDSAIILADHTSHFTDRAKLTRLVLLQAEAGQSAGTAHNLFLLLSATSPMQLIWAAQTGDLDTAFTDLDGDGIMDVIEWDSMLWMGEYNRNWSIFDLRGGSRHQHYNAHSYSLLEMEGFPLDHLKKGDTVELIAEPELLNASNRSDSSVRVRTKTTVLRYNGGQDVEQIRSRAQVSRSVELVPL